MLANSYCGIVEPNVPRLVVSRARRLRISGDEIDDLQQQIVPKLATFEYDPAKANGATLNTVLTVVVDRQILAHLRAKRRHEQRVERLRAMSDLASSRFAWPEQVAKPEPVDLRMDIAAAMDRLDERDRAICHRLGEGHTIKAIAEHVGCCRDTVSRAILRIRQVFTEAGLREWIDPDHGDGTDRA